ncbi:cytochrome-c oxidase, cbb3-type subunit III [Roseobacter sp.]|uniref:cytochrome-c oxidase, cbb3-type subunit III n=1 Tax=Roseobacter sp. TaxID=1907202 RepID=UPI0025CF1000|nr:cytochrome-c oxidase, cbb3-type subunit III [Roseobacter sp.]
MTKVPPKQEGDPDTTGHSWDGIEEFDNPMPRWWLWTFYITIIWGIGYTIAYPAWPLVSSATAGILGYSTRGEVITEIAAVEEANAGINAQLAEAEITEISLNPELNSYAVSAGGAVYRTWCTQCHGSGAGGAVGYPNLLDNDWLWGGSVEAIYLTVAHGIRNEEDPDARYSEMPVFGDILEEDEIAQVANYVMTLSGGTPVDAAASQAGEAIYADNCTACHGENGLGNNDLGAPNIADQIWLYGGDYDTLVETVTYSRYGVMPPWQQRLSEAELRAVSLYVHQLGGGE